MIPYGRQSISEADCEAVLEVLRSDFLTQGPKVPAFEQAIAQYCGTAHALAVNSATSALHIACRALEVGPGDLVWTSPITFVASANCALYCGAEIDFVDIDPGTFNLSVDALQQKLEAAALENRLPSVVIPVHLCGLSCDMQRIAELANVYGFKVIEDASHAIGAHYRGLPVGSCQYSDITVFSFHPVKIITTAEGGMALTCSAELAQRMALLRSHGITREPAQLRNADIQPWEYEQQQLGYNYRMSELHAALGLTQAKRLDSFIERRNQLAARYREAFAHLPVQVQQCDANSRCAYHLFPIVLDPARHNRRTVFEQLRTVGIGVNVHYQPVYQQPYFQQLGFSHSYCPNAERYYAGAISLPLFQDLNEIEQTQVIGAVERILCA